MRKGFIYLVIIIYISYCFASIVYQNQYTLPNYVIEDVDLLGKKSKAEWDSDTAHQFNQLMILESMHYQPLISKPLVLKSGKTISPNSTLTAKDFAELISAGTLTISLRNPKDINNFVSKHYLIRNIIPNTNYVGGETITKAVIDDLLSKNIATIPVSGKGSPVSAQLGTVIMVLLVFLALVAALKPMVWDPFVSMLDNREAIIEEGDELAQANKLEEHRIEEEKKIKLQEINHELSLEISKERQKAAKEADKIMRNARSEERRIKTSSLAELSKAEEEAKEFLKKELPELTQLIVKSLIGHEAK